MLTVSKTWPESSRDRFARHRLKRFTPIPIQGQRPALLREAQGRLEPFFAGRYTGRPQGLAAAVSARGLLYHYRLTRTGKQRKARNQRYHTDHELLACLLEHCNVQPRSALAPLQLTPLPVRKILELTGLARSTVQDALRRYRELGLIQTKRRKSPNDRTREIVAIRWLTNRLFAVLGLRRQLARQLGARTPAVIVPSSTTNPSPKPEASPADRMRAYLAHIDALRRAVHKPPPASA